MAYKIVRSERGIEKQQTKITELETTIAAALEALDKPGTWMVDRIIATRKVLKGDK